MVTMNIENLEPPPEDMVIAPQVEIRASEVDSERLGIWCKETIAAGTKFGPFQGERVQVGTRDMDPSFVWEIVDLETKEFLFYINATDRKSGNWMRYINCARYFEEQNIVCKQEGMDIYYASIKDIQPGEELLTWYEKTPFRKRKSKPVNKKTKDELVEVEVEVKGNGETEIQGGDMHTSQRGRRRKVTKYWEMENADISEVSDFQRDSEVNSEDDDDDVMIASDDDWSVNGRDEAMKEDGTGEVDGDGSLFFRFEVQPYHVVLSRLGRKVFQCDVCSGIYRHSFSLKRHYIRNHVNHAFVSSTDLIHCNITVSKNGEKEDDVEKKSEDAEKSGEDEMKSEDVVEKTDCGMLDQDVEQNTENVESKNAGEKSDNADVKSEDAGMINVDADKKGEDAEKKSKDTDIDNTDADKKSEDADEKIEDADEKIEDADEKSVDVDEKIEDTDEKIEDADEKIEDADENIEDADENIEDADEKIEDADENIKDDEKIVDADEKIEDADEKIEDADENIKDDEKIVDADEKIEDADEKIENADENIEDADEKNVDTEEKSVDVDEKIEADKIEDANEKIEDAEEKNVDVDNKIEDADEKIEDAEEKSIDVDEKIEDAEEKIGDADEKIENADEKIENADVKSAVENKTIEDEESAVAEKEDKMAENATKTNVKSEDGDDDCTDALRELDGDKKSELGATENDVEMKQVKADDAVKIIDEDNREKENEDPDKKCEEDNAEKSEEEEDLEKEAEEKTEDQDEEDMSTGKKSPDVDQNSNSSDEVNSNPSEHSAASFKAPQRMADLYRCNVCEKLFDSIPGLKAHLANHPESSSKAYACDKCNMKFSHKQNLMRHAAVHTVLGPKPFICKFCGKKFSTLTNQRRHERIHQGRRLSCQHCTSTFSQTGDLKKHVKKFHPEFFHDCPGCAKYYATTEELVEHATQAHGERVEEEDTGNHLCKFCSKRFVTSTSKRRHERVHQGVRMQCPHCRSSFSQTPALKKHIKKLHSDKFHECSLCGKFFNSAASLTDHTTKSHSSENSSSALVSCYALDTESDKAESMRLAYQRSSTCTKPQLKYACTVCRKQFHDYSNMCRHRSMAHHQQMLQLSSLKKPDDSSPLRSLFDPDMERNSAFYAKVARNIADNLKFHMEGTQEGLNQSETLIKWHREEVEPEQEEEKSVQDLLEGYNFPQGYQLQDNADLLTRKVPLNDYIEWSGLIEAEKKRSVVTSKEHQEEQQQQEQCSEEQRDTPPSLSPNGSMSLRVPAMKLCRICHSVFHNEEVFQEHIQRQHGARMGTPPHAHHHPRPLQLLPPRWLPGINPNRIPSLVIPPNAVPPPAHQSSTSPAPPQLSPAPPLLPQLMVASPLQEKKQEEKKDVEKEKEDQVDDVSILVTGDDPDPSPKKHICLVCYDEFSEVEALSAHQKEQHSSVQCKGLTVDLSFTATWYTRPTAVGLLDVTSNQIPILEEEQQQSETHCTKCEKEFASKTDLHAHILDCGDYGRNAPRLAYIWYLRGQVITPSKKGKKTGYGKYRRGRNTMHHQQKKKKWVEESEVVREEAQLMAQRRLLERALESPDEDSSEYGQRRRRRRVQELFYNPNKHVRRRDLAELLGSRCFGCGQTFEVVSLLERHIATCPDKEKILGSSEGLANRQMLAEEEDSDNEYDANKHMCIYCERYFTYLGMLRKHVLDVCAVRRELVEADEYIDEEWEADLDVKTGHAATSGRRTLSRQSSMSSLNGVLAEELENSQDSFEQRPRRKRRRRGHNWGYKPKGSKRRAEEEEAGTPYMIEESFFADIESSNSRVASVGEDESSNDSTLLAKKEQMKELKEEEEEKKSVKEEKVKDSSLSKPKQTKSKKKTAQAKKETPKKTPAKTLSKKKPIELDEDDVKLSELAKKRKSKSPNPTPKKAKTDEPTVNGNLPKKKRKSEEVTEKKTVKKPRNKPSEIEKPKLVGKKLESSLAGNMQLKGKAASKKSIA